jgi:hypothetical protein
VKNTARILFSSFLVIAVTLSIAACSGIPRSGLVQQGAAVAADDSSTIEFLPSSPTEGATQEQILRGFLDAASSPQDDFAIAREYLAGSFASSWDASASVTIDLGARTVVPATDTAASLQTMTSATVDSRGQYREVTPVTAVTQEFDFIQESGQWRISAAPPGVILDTFTFDQVFSTHALYFFDPTFTQLVPDLRYFPSGSSTATRIMKALLQGPSEWLAEGGAVVSAFPAGTALVADAVPIAARMAKVDLTSQALEATREGLIHMQAQASASLSTVDGVSGVGLLVDGNEQEIALSSNPNLDITTRLDARPLVSINGRFGYLTGDSVEPIEGLSRFLQPLNASAITVAASQILASARTEAGVVMVRSDQGVTLVDAREGLISPTLDPSNYIWSVPTNAPTEVNISSGDGQVTQLVAPWPEATRIVALNIARDGSRLVALLQQAGQTRFVAANVQRGERNRPVAIGTPFDLKTSSGIPLDATWADPFTVVSLVQSADGQSRLVSQPLGGKSQELPSSGPLVSLAGANMLTQLRTRSAEGNLFVLRGASYWQLIASDVSVLGTLQ